MASAPGAAITAQEVEAVVLQFYRSGGGGAAGAASPGGTATAEASGSNNWLTAAQSSPSAWQFAFQLVDMSKNPEVQFFGANTLVVKVSKHFDEVPPSEFSSLQQRLLQLLNQYMEQRGPKIVLTRLCVAVAHLAIRGISTGLWASPVENLINAFQQEMEKRGVGVLGLLLELLTIIPEEFATSVMPTSKRAIVRADLTRSLDMVIDIIRKVFNEGQNLSTEIQVQTMKCLQAWVQFGIPNEVTEELFTRLIASLRDEELYDCSLDAMGSVVSHPNAHKYPNTMRRIMTNVVELDSIFYKLMSEENFEMALPLASFFITFGESHSRMMLDWSIESEQGRDVTIRLVSTILHVSICNAQYPTSETLSEMPFGFWYIFQVGLLKHNCLSTV